MKEIDCRIFQDQLDSLQAGSLPEEGLRQLRLHAASCPDCAMSLKVVQHLLSPSLKELEALVSDDLLAAVWTGVEAELGREVSPGAEPVLTGKTSAKGAAPRWNTDLFKGTSGPGAAGLSWQLPGASIRGWLVPTLAAASLALLLSTGFLSLRLRSAESMGARLASEVADLQREAAGSGARPEWVQRTARLAGNRRTQAWALDFALAGQETVTVQALLDLLEQLPPDLVLFEATRVNGLLGTPVRPPPELREILMGMAEAISNLGQDRGVRAGDLERWLAASGLPRDLAVPKATLLDLLS